MTTTITVVNEIALFCYYSLGVSTVMLTTLVIRLISKLCTKLKHSLLQRFELFNSFLVLTQNITTSKTLKTDPSSATQQTLSLNIININTHKH